MKLQDLNRSFAKVLAAVAIAFTISAAPAHAQQAQWGADRCYYAVQGGQWVRQGCMLQLNGNQFYYDIRTSVMTDLRTRSSFRLARQNGRLYVNAGTRWADAGPAPAGLPAQPAQLLRPGEIAPGVRENIPQDASLMTPEEKAWVQKSNGQMLGIMTGQTHQTHCENGGGLNGTRYNDTLLGPQQKQCTYP